MSGFSEITAPLNRLLKKGQKFCWTYELGGVFQSLNTQLVSNPVFEVSTSGQGVCFIHQCRRCRCRCHVVSEGWKW